MCWMRESVAIWGLDMRILGGKWKKIVLGESVLFGFPLYLGGWARVGKSSLLVEKCERFVEVGGCRGPSTAALTMRL